MEETTAVAEDYEELCRNFSITVPRYFNFGYDIIDTWAEKDRNKARDDLGQPGGMRKEIFLP